MKKILLIHNLYQQEGGEDIAVQNEVKVLQKSFNVKTIYFDNEINNYFLQLIYFLINKNLKSIKKIEKIYLEFEPDIVYIHNTWFKVSPHVFILLKKLDAKIVLKLHNYRFFCTRYFLSRNHLTDFKKCKACGYEKNSIAILNKYYTTSYLKSLFLIIYGKKYFNILKNGNLQIVCLNNFQKKFIEKLGISKNKISIVPNYSNFESNNIYDPDSKYIVYAGRISKEKGLEYLIDSFTQIEKSDLKLKIIGEGPLLNNLKKLYHNDNIEFLGKISNIETVDIIKKSRAVVSATSLYEVQPTLLCEASFNSIPSIFPDNGGISEYFPSDYFLKYNLETDKELFQRLLYLQDKEILKKASKEAKKFITTIINEENYLNKLEAVFNVS